MKIAVYQTVIGGGGGTDKVLFTLLNKLKNDDVTVFCQSNLIKLNAKVVQLLPFRLPMLGIYQNMLNTRTPKQFADFDMIYVLSGNMVINTTKIPMKFFNSNNFGLSSDGKYRSGLWKLYYLPYKIMINKFKKDIKKSNVEFISNSMYSASLLEKDFGVKSIVQYHTINPKEFHSINSKAGIINISRFSPEKNMDFTIRVFNSFDNCKIYANLSTTNKPYYNRITRNNASPVFLNQKRDVITDALARAKVYFHSSKETFGLAVVESIASGCIPIVPDNSAHQETVPFEELRYLPDNYDSAVIKLRNALDGKYDYLLPSLKDHLRNFI